MTKPFDIDVFISQLDREKRIAESMARQWKAEAERVELNLAALRELEDKPHD